MENPILDVKNIYKNFKEVKAVDGVSFFVNRGEFIALLGPNGAGKTTTVEMIEGIQKPNQGTISIMGMNWDNHENKLHRLISLSLQETRFIDKLRVWETVQLFASFYGLSRDRVDEVIGIVALTEKRKSFVQNLSGGQRQKLALAIALLNNAPLLLLDEPTTGLDPTARREIWNILMNLKKNNNTSLILTTHYMEEAEYLCDRIIIMDKGKILAQGTLEELLSASNSKEIIEFSTNDIISEELFCVDDVYKLIRDENSNSRKLIVRSIVDQLPVFLQKVKDNGINLSRLECRKLTLDDLFISMTGKHLGD
ncbi:MAG: ABC transporter ATP-binding protein [Bacteroidetes bacterium GWC2_33_15]|nr:MAG: ABC transporter ATP-binding protein [Bacteroidetes bacterium GWA2_33_15]OFX48594.1 MAG: ABC transporter ATP-binding protein [Bacteroidetes bacterium GWC2_33_15]OFX64568.1 MAG: ABC transporter ATP-binding protein [Bacteroidetes bacterium GWB2_32_14]OFX68014.1 MAG: ABC transporter ATP-binding protein [Bacteroidetes bacterium GWD2_33_33]HAN18250.1 ABC transporter ATP-binding protein [Bacteroidales bacterium]